MKLIRMVLWGLVLVIGAVVGGVTVGRLLTSEPQFATNTPLGAAQIRARYADAGGPFSALNAQGERVTEADFAGKPRAMFFGFTHCPDVCPTALLEAQQWLDELGDEADEITIMFVTVDPEDQKRKTLTDNVNLLALWQRERMARQPDLLIQFVHQLHIDLLAKTGKVT